MAKQELGAGVERGAPTPFSLGVGEDLLTVDPHRLRLVDLPPGRFPQQQPHGERREPLALSTVELTTPALAHAGDAHETLTGLRQRLTAADITVLGAGLHPDGAFGEVTHPHEGFYSGVAEDCGGVLDRTPTCGIQVRVGMPDHAIAVHALNGMRRWVPPLLALSASSPFWHGRDAGLASARGALRRSCPRSGVPRPFRDYDDYLATVAEVEAAGALPDPAWIWWDLRIDPRHGTLEVRASDAQSSLRDLTGIVALTHCLAIDAATHPPIEQTAPEALDQCCFRAIRHGSDAVLHFDGRMQPFAEVVEQALACARPYAADLGCQDELDEVRRLLTDGTSADRQRTVHASSGLDGLLTTLCAETQPGHALPDLARL
ncbi:YbdK family carboxylate-amine ligase [Conexibacter sp. JD483]|uniref:carboxylate-amine ligase n=1 Tax=unclassified Conexibacter TaxID=2627773 RepID=UPI00271E089A|nr:MULTISPECIES: YbdK family carboxylate-amine ligase [unclassified Conexibacter]MDO8188612.1 YbdK family carboxylate-amine ligase [Conexibacter sp. CPCC 205706]MDO8201502.1 YbdK family carboxylate-amine ligase [Conexibacter sp. CPCC 205762]MDR9370869.1 YbdK family carboxylate-amine ligase [Conexibacter sp. JD483]